MTTLKEIAKKANVSIGTVDRVIHNRGRVSQDNIDKVKAIMSELGYQANIFAKQLKQQKSYALHVVMPEADQDGSYWQLIQKGVDRAAEELKPFNFYIQPHYYNFTQETTLTDAINALLASDSIDAVTLAMHDVNAAQALVEQLPEDTSIALVDSDIPEIRPHFLISQDAYQAGRLSGQLIRLAAEGRSGDVLVINNPNQSLHILNRIKGLHDYLNEHHNQIRLVTATLDYSSQTIFNHSLVELLEKHHSLIGIHATDANTYAVGQFVKTHDISLFVTGYDVTPKSVELIQDGIINFVIDQQPERQGYQSMMSHYHHHILRQPFTARQMTQLNIVTQENYHYYL